MAEDPESTKQRKRAKLDQLDKKSDEVLRNGHLWLVQTQSNLDRNKMPWSHTWANLLRYSCKEKEMFKQQQKWKHSMQPIQGSSMLLNRKRKVFEHQPSWMNSVEARQDPL